MKSKLGIFYGAKQCCGYIFFQIKMPYSVDDIVWVNLGKSYGCWPAQVQDSEKRIMEMKEYPFRNIKFEGGEEFQYPSTGDGDRNCNFVKFFDDDSKEWLEIKDQSRIQKYSCKDKLKLIKVGFKNLDETKKGGLGGVNLRLAQFYKDVEMAEVMTDNDVRVADILARYEVMETEDNAVSEIIPEDNNTEEKTAFLEDTPSVSRGGKSKSKSKDVLREIKNGSVRKAKKKQVKKNK